MKFYFDIRNIGAILINYLTNRKTFIINNLKKLQGMPGERVRVGIESPDLESQEIEEEKILNGLKPINDQIRKIEAVILTKTSENENLNYKNEIKNLAKTTVDPQTSDLEVKSRSTQPETNHVIDESLVIGTNNDASMSVVHDFSLKRYPFTMISLLKFIVKGSIGFTALIFHILVGYLVCFVVNVIPMPKQLRNVLLRSINNYIGIAFNSIIGLWFYNKFYVSMDPKLAKMLKDLKMKNENPCLLTISNHASEMDWLFFFKITASLDLFRYTIILIKKELSKVPIMGYLMKSVGHAFIERDRSKDSEKRSCDMVSVNNFAKNIIDSKSCRRASEIPVIGWIYEKISALMVYLRIIRKTPGANGLYFPEATIFEESTYKATTEFYLNALKTPEEFPGIFRPNYVLLPRPLGTTALLTKLADKIDGIIDSTILIYPFVPATYNCCSYWDIVSCRAPPFSFGVLLDLLEVPDNVKKSIKDMGDDTNNFEFPQKLTDGEKNVKYEVSKFLNKVYSRKDSIIKKYVEGETKGDFKNLADFDSFTNSLEANNKRISYPLRIDSHYAILILSAPFIFFSVGAYLIFK